MPGMQVGSIQAKLYEVSISGMSCQRCVNAITDSLKELPLTLFEIKLVGLRTHIIFNSIQRDPNDRALRPVSQVTDSPIIFHTRGETGN